MVASILNGEASKERKQDKRGRKRERERSNGNFSKNETRALQLAYLWSRYAIFFPTDELADYFSCRNYAGCVNAIRRP